MTTKSIRVSEDVYKKLVEIAGKLQAEYKKSLSIEDAIRYLLKSKITDLAGAWEVSKEEVHKIKKSLERGWKAWKPSA